MCSHAPFSGSVCDVELIAISIVLFNRALDSIKKSKKKKRAATHPSIQKLNNSRCCHRPGSPLIVAQLSAAESQPFLGVFFGKTTNRTQWPACRPAFPLSARPTDSTLPRQQLFLCKNTMENLYDMIVLPEHLTGLYDQLMVISFILLFSCTFFLPFLRSLPILFYFF